MRLLFFLSCLLFHFSAFAAEAEFYELFPKNDRCDRAKSSCPVEELIIAHDNMVDIEAFLLEKATEKYPTKKEMISFCKRIKTNIKEYSLNGNSTFDQHMKSMSGRVLRLEWGVSDLICPDLEKCLRAPHRGNFSARISELKEIIEAEKSGRRAW